MEIENLEKSELSELLCTVICYANYVDTHTTDKDTILEYYKSVIPIKFHKYLISKIIDLDLYLAVIHKRTQKQVAIFKNNIGKEIYTLIYGNIDEFTEISIDAKKMYDKRYSVDEILSTVFKKLIIYKNTNIGFVELKEKCYSNIRFFPTIYYFIAMLNLQE